MSCTPSPRVHGTACTASGGRRQHRHLGSPPGAVSREVVARSESRAYSGGLIREKLLQVEANVDDCSPQDDSPSHARCRLSCLLRRPQVLAYAAERLLAAGALDSWIAPILMKKGRAGHLLAALIRPDSLDAAVSCFLTETTSLGVRVTECDRFSCHRSFEQVDTQWGPVHVKIGSSEPGGPALNVHAEFDDCVAVSRASGVPLKIVFDDAHARFHAKKCTMDL